MSRGKWFLVGLLGFVIPALMAPTGGLPSRPMFQQVTATLSGVGGTSQPSAINIGPSAVPSVVWNSTGFPANHQLVACFANGAANVINCSFVSNDGSTRSPFLVATRGTNEAVSQVAIGNSTDNPTVLINGVTANNTIVCSTACNVANIKPGQSAMVKPGGAQTRASTTTKTNDADLQFTNMPAGLYSFSAKIEWSPGAGGESAAYGTVPQGAEYVAANQCNGAAGTPGTIVGNANFFACPSTTGTDFSVDSGTMNAGANDTFALLWAQQSSNAASSQRTASSYLTITRLN